MRGVFPRPSTPRMQMGTQNASSIKRPVIRFKDQEQQKQKEKQSHVKYKSVYVDKCFFESVSKCHCQRL